MDAREKLNNKRKENGGEIKQVSFEILANFLRFSKASNMDDLIALGWVSGP